VDLSSYVFGPLVIPRTRRRTTIVIAIAIALYVGFLIARLENSDQKNGLLGLQVIPIALVALELGLLPGLLMATAALGSVAIWSVADDVHISAGEYVARGAVYFPIAIAIGWVAGRLHLTEQALENREQRLATIVESSTDALVTMDEDGLILAWNPVAEEMFGWRPDEVMDMGPMGKYHMFNRPHGMIGGMMNRPPEMPAAPPMWTIYFRVPDINEATARIKANGGSITNGPQEVPGGDWIVNAVDPQGAHFALHAKKA